jgi:uncharacterized protein (TIGR00369 family)
MRIERRHADGSSPERRNSHGEDRVASTREDGRLDAGPAGRRRISDGSVAAVDPSKTFAATPCNRWLGLRLVQRSLQRVEVELPVRAEFLQEEGVVQGGILTALADTAAVWLLWPDLDPMQAMTGTGCSMQFLAAGTLDGGPLRAVATPLRVGRTLAVSECEVHQSGRLVAKGTFTFLFRSRRTDTP